MSTRARDRIRVLTPAFLRVAVMMLFAVAAGWLFGRTFGLWVAVVGLGFLLATHLFYASLLAGWLEGAVAAETLEVRIRTGGGVGRHRSLARVDGD